MPPKVLKYSKSRTKRHINSHQKTNHAITYLHPHKHPQQHLHDEQSYLTPHLKAPSAGHTPNSCNSTPNKSVQKVKAHT
jgi:hypothetical protein